MSRLTDNVWVDGVLYPVGSRPTGDAAARIGDHAWEDGDPTVLAPGQTSLSGSTGPGPADGVHVPPDTDGALIDVDLDDEVDGSGETAPKPPPKGGPKGSKQAWLDYAAAVEVDVDPDAGRDEVIAAVAAAGKPTE